MTFYRLALFGDPVAHSLSPAIHQAGLAAAGLSGTYLARAVTTAGMAGAVDEVRCGRLTGANVTMPHKAIATDLCDRLVPDAAAARAVNTLVRAGDGIEGHNTDISGIRRAWEWTGLPEGRVLVLGAGGAAAAALLACRGWRISIAARRAQAARDLVAAVGAEARVVDWEQPVSGAVVINATPLGMHGEHLPEPVLATAGGLFDMAYGAGPTAATLEARERGLPIAAGPDMLLGQALEAFELWTGTRADVDAMRTALNQGLETDPAGA